MDLPLIVRLMGMGLVLSGIGILDIGYWLFNIGEEWGNSRYSISDIT